MTRLSLLTFFALAFSGVALAAPPASQEIVAAGGLFTGGSWSYTDCGGSSDTVTIKSIEISPDPPKPGQEITVTVAAETHQVIEEGAYADVAVKMGRIKLLTKTFDLCEEAVKANATVQCPVEKGNYVVTQTASLPKEIPPGKFTVNVQGFTVNEEEMFCLNLVVVFSPFLHLW